MSCVNFPISGLNKGCRDSKGGIVKVWVTTDTNIPTVNCSLGTNGEISHIDTSIATASVWKPYEFFKHTGSMTSTLNYSETAGSSYSTELNLQFMKMEAAKRIEVQGLMMNETNVIVKDANKQYHYLGWDESCEGTAGTGVTGTNSTDLNGYTVTITDDSMELPRVITDEDFITALEAITIA